MGSTLSNIGSAIGGAIKAVAPQILQAVAPAATKLLTGITDGFVSSGANFLKGAVDSILPSPLAKIADSLIGKGADALKSLGGGLIEKGLGKLMEMVTGRSIPGVGNINVPGLTTPERQAAIAGNQTPPATGSSGSAATTGTNSAGSSGSASSPNLPPDPKNYGDLKDNANLQQLMTDRQAYQDARQMMMDTMKFNSDLSKAASDTLNAIARNVK